MTDEERRYIIYENENGKTFRSLAAEMEITPQAITNDRRRHRDKWEREKAWLDLTLRSERHKVFDEFITQAREDLIKIMSNTRIVDEARQEALAADIRPKLLSEFLKKNEALKIKLAEAEKRLHIFLAILLDKRYELSSPS